MATADEAENGEVALKKSHFRNDVRRRFPQKMEQGCEEEIELSLGLSLNGRFGLDPIRARMLDRSSSVADFSLNHRAVKEEEAFVVPSSEALMRTCSLPAETDELRKRKELQMQRMEAKRKQRSLRPMNRSSPSGVELKAERGGLPPSQGSIGSLVSGSSGISDLDSTKNIQIIHVGMKECTEAASVDSLTESENKSPAVTGTTITEKAGKFSSVIMKNQSNKRESPTSSVLESMPRVSAKGDGPNGKRIQGFLYRYRKGEDLSIVCVCHGSLHSPAEFIKHAGGSHVDHPLKHILVLPSPFL